MISEQLGIQTWRLKPSDLKKVNLDDLGTAGDAAFQLLVTKHMHKLRRLQNFIKTLQTDRILAGSVPPPRPRHSQLSE